MKNPGRGQSLCALAECARPPCYTGGTLSIFGLIH